MVLSIVFSMPLLLVYSVGIYLGPESIFNEYSVPIVFLTLVGLPSLLARKLLLKFKFNVKYPFFTFMGSFLLNVIGMAIAFYIYRSINTS